MDYHQTNTSHPVTDTIAACATGRVRAGIAVIRISGSQSWQIARKLTHKALPAARSIQLAMLYDTKREHIDQAMVIPFRAPASYTGEDIVELHCHGSPLVVEMILETIYQHGARAAQPGEFSKRAFINNKIDLTRAEATADLINAQSRQAARNALHSLQGVFASQITAIVNDLTSLRVLVEAHLDFPEEDIDEQRNQWLKILSNIDDTSNNLLTQARVSCKVNNGFRLVLLGPPNSGKSTLFNCLLQTDKAIVSDTAGTTRDLVEQRWHYNGIDIELIDTAGLRTTRDHIESIGMEKALQESKKADHILYLYDNEKETFAMLDTVMRNYDGQVTCVRTKTDLDTPQTTLSRPKQQLQTFHISAKTEQGLEALRRHIHSSFITEHLQEDSFSARQRHIDALQTALRALHKAREGMTAGIGMELVAQELLDAQNALAEITGAVTSDDLLGVIFSSFCIGK